MVRLGLSCIIAFDIILGRPLVPKVPNYMTLGDILSDPPKPHKDSQGGFMVMGLTESALTFIYNNIGESCVTLETGCALSTVVFAVKGSSHTVIAPAPDEFEITRAYCHERGIPTGQINFIMEPSQKILPVLES